MQRRITIRLPPELDVVRQLRLVREWCQENLSEVAWHVCIHRDPDGGDAWRDTAHVVYTQFALTPERDANGRTGWWTFERAGRLPLSAKFIKVLWGKGEEGRRGTVDLIKRWRAHLEVLCAEHLKASASPRGSQAQRPGQASASGQGQGEAESSGAQRSVPGGRAASEWLANDLADWRESLAREPDGARVGRLAMSVARRLRGDKARWQESLMDPRPEVRALLAHRWRFNHDIAPFQRRIRAIFVKSRPRA